MVRHREAGRPLAASLKWRGSSVGIGQKEWAYRLQCQDRAHGRSVVERGPSPRICNSPKLELNVSFPSLSNHRLGKLLAGSPPNSAAATATIENDRRLLRRDRSLPICQRQVLTKKHPLYQSGLSRGLDFNPVRRTKDTPGCHWGGGVPRLRPRHKSLAR